jgi:hypothetical protein
VSMSRKIAVLAAALVVIPRVAQAEPAAMLSWHWDACTPVVWSYNGTGAPEGRRHKGRGYKATRSAAQWASRLSGHAIHEAGPGEVPNLTISWNAFDSESGAHVIPEITEVDAAGDPVSTGAVMELNPKVIQLTRGLQRGVVLHEFGHVLGLNHTTTPGELMSPTGGVLTADDIAAFAQLPKCGA